MATMKLTPEVLPLIAERFRALADPARLQLLVCLREEESMTVTELAEETGMNQANTSKHLQVLHEKGFVTREKDGLFVRYSLAGADVFRLCDVMCGRLEREARARQRLIQP
jgi:DNA-binding transcriptional ArsR family regulator